MPNCPGPTWNVIIDPPMPGSLNMAIDDLLLAQCNDRPVLRLYQWIIPTLSIGMAQPVERHVNIDECRKRGIPVVRRLTGGKAVLHDRELTYSLTGPLQCPPFNCPLLDSYREIGNAFCESLKKLGIEAVMAARDARQPKGSVTSCFAAASASEILVSGKKLLGSAQKRTRNRVLQHGSLLMEYLPEDWNAVMLRCDKTTHEHVTNLKTLLGHEPPVETLIQAICEGFQQVFGVGFRQIRLPESDRKQAHRIAVTRYVDPAARLDIMPEQQVQSYG